MEEMVEPHLVYQTFSTGLLFIKVRPLGYLFIVSANEINLKLYLLMSVVTNINKTRKVWLK